MKTGLLVTFGSACIAAVDAIRVQQDATTTSGETVTPIVLSASDTQDLWWSMPSSTDAATDEKSGDAQTEIANDISSSLTFDSQAPLVTEDGTTLTPVKTISEVRVEDPATAEELPWWAKQPEPSETTTETATREPLGDPVPASTTTDDDTAAFMAMMAEQQKAMEEQLAAAALEEEARLLEAEQARIAEQEAAE